MQTFSGAISKLTIIRTGEHDLTRNEHDSQNLDPLKQFSDNVPRNINQAI